MSSWSEHIGTVQGLNLAVSLCLTYTLCIALIRLWIRKGAFGFDDIVVLVTTIFTLGHTTADYIALAYGLGKPFDVIVDEERLPQLNQTTIAGVMTFIIALYLTKICVLAFLCRITKNKTQIHIYHACTAVMVVLAFVSALTVTVNCHAGSGLYWAFNDNTRSCPAELPRWQIFTAFDIISELLLLALPVQLVWNLQMPLRKKAMVLTAFYLRAPTIGLSLIRNYFTLHLTDSSSDPGQDGAIVVIWMEIQLAYALAANTLSALKAFTESFNSGFGQGFTRARGDHYDMSGLSKGSGGSSSKNEKKDAAGHVVDDNAIKEEFNKDETVRDVWSRSQSPMRLRPDGDGNNMTRVSAEPGRLWKHENSGNHSSGDEFVIVRETELSVHHDEAPMLEHAR